VAGDLLVVLSLMIALGPMAWLGGALILAAAVAITTRGHAEMPETLVE
jgi:hypothetical protein